jgi:hypothetical protein
MEDRSLTNLCDVDPSEMMLLRNDDPRVGDTL